MTRKTVETFSKVNDAFNRFQGGSNRSRVVTRNLGKSHYSIAIVSKEESASSPVKKQRSRKSVA